LAPVPVTSVFIPDASEAEGVIQSLPFTDIGFIAKQVIKVGQSLYYYCCCI
jgi:hypothetical protein